MTQRKKNIRLLAFLIGMIIITILTAILLKSSDEMDIDKNLFALNDDSVDAIRIISDESIDLKSQNNIWLVNDKYKSDPQRVNVLFAILRQVRVRRKVSDKQVAHLKSLETIGVKLFNSGNEVESFFVVGDESKGLTYLTEDKENFYLVEIPGYRNYLASIFHLDRNGWRYPLIFDLNWSNLAGVEVDYPKASANDLKISFENNQLAIQGAKTDSLKLGEFVDDISLLYVNDFLNQNEVDSSLLQSKQASIIVTDIASNEFVLDIYGQIDSEYLVVIDSTDIGLVEAAQIHKVTKPRSYFIKR